MDLKVQILEACQSGKNYSQAAQRFSVSPGFVSKLMKIFRKIGSLVDLKKKNEEEKLGKLVSENPGINARQLRDKLRLDASTLTVWRALRRLKFTVKKNGYAR